MVQTRYGRCKDTDTLPTNTGQNRLECSEASWQVRYWSVKGDSCFFNWKTAVSPPPPTLNYSSRPSLGFAKRHFGECRSVKVKVENRYTNSNTIQCLIRGVRKINSSPDFGFDMFFQPVIPSSHFVFENTWGWQCICQQSGKTLRVLSLLSPVALTKKKKKKICAVSNFNTHTLCACETMCERSLWNNMNVQNYTDWNVLTSLQLEEYNHWYSE